MANKDGGGGRGKGEDRKPMREGGRGKGEGGRGKGIIQMTRVLMTCQRTW